MKWMISFFKKLSIKTKIEVSFSLVSIFSLIALVSVSYVRNSEVLKENIQEMSFRDANILKMDIERYMGLDSETYIRGISNISIADVLSKDFKKYNDYEKAQFVKQLNHYVTELESNRIIRIRIFIEDERLLFSDGRNLFPMGNIEEQSWYHELLKMPDEIQWSAPHYPDYFPVSEKIITANYLLTNPQNFMEPICVVSVDFSEKGLRDLLNSRIIAGKHFVTIIDDRSRIISTTDYNKQFSRKFLSNIAGEDSWHSIKYHHEKYMTLSLPIEKTPWHLLYIVNLNAALESIAKIRDFMILLSCGMIALVVLLSNVLSRIMTKRIVSLRDAAVSISEGNLNITLDTDDYCDEISDMQRSFCKMVSRLSDLLDERFQMAINLKNAEIKALQAQINPHFLYNTLDIISWKAIRQKNYDIYHLIKNLAKYYKLSLNQGQDIVPLADELDHIKYYVNIQNERMNHVIQLTIDIDDGLRNHTLPKLTLQPIVENSILHGLMEKDPPGGKISIDALFHDNVVEIRIVDDGVGIGPEKLEGILGEQISSDHHTGYGLSNVRYRLRLTVGGDLKIESKPDLGTKVTILLPDRKDSDTSSMD